MISKGQSFISGILRVVNPLGKRSFFCLLRFEIQKNYDVETLKFKLHSFIPSELYVNCKDPTHGRAETASVFQFSARNLWTYFFYKRILKTRYFLLWKSVRFSELQIVIKIDWPYCITGSSLCIMTVFIRSKWLEKITNGQNSVGR